MKHAFPPLSLSISFWAGDRAYTIYIYPSRPPREDKGEGEKKTVLDHKIGKALGAWPNLDRKIPLYEDLHFLCTREGTGKDRDGIS